MVKVRESWWTRAGLVVVTLFVERDVSSSGGPQIPKPPIIRALNGPMINSRPLMMRVNSKEMMWNRTSENGAVKTLTGPLRTRRSLIMSRMDIISASLWIQIFLIGKRLFYCIAFLFPISYLIMTDTVKSTCSNIYFLSLHLWKNWCPSASIANPVSFFAQDFWNMRT